MSGHIETLIATELTEASLRLASRFKVVPFDGDSDARRKLVVFANGFEKPEGEVSQRFEDIWPKEAIWRTVEAVLLAFPQSKRLFVRSPLRCTIHELDPEWPEQRPGVAASIRCVGDEVFT